MPRFPAARKRLKDDDHGQKQRSQNNAKLFEQSVVVAVANGMCGYAMGPARSIKGPRQAALLLFAQAVSLLEGSVQFLDFLMVLAQQVVYIIMHDSLVVS
jgi:hypothetical protein